MRLFHGSPSSDVTAFLELTHFGTREAALHRLQNRHSGVGYLYECEIDMPTTIHEGHDIGSPKPAGILSAIDGRGYLDPDGSIERDRIVSRHRRLEVEALHGKDGPLYPAARRRMSDILDEHGIQVISYENIVETAGSTSYIVCSRKVRIEILARNRVVDGATTDEELNDGPVAELTLPQSPRGLVGKLIAWTRKFRRRTGEGETNIDGPPTSP